MPAGVAILGAVVCGLSVAGRQEVIVDLFFESVFGSGWTFNDFFSVVLAPALQAVLLPVAAAVGAGLGVLIGRRFASSKR